MKNILVILLFIFLRLNGLSAQAIDPALLSIKQRMDSIAAFSTNLRLEVDIPFINMPVKTARMSYKKGTSIKFSSNDFVLIPKRGLDFSLNGIFEYAFITVDRGMEKRNGQLLKVINIIPTDKRADFSIATLLLDTKNRRVMESEINTKKDGAYNLLMHYADQYTALPDRVEVNFEIEKLKIPINFMGKDTDIDRKKMRATGTKTGKIFLTMSSYQLVFIK